MVHMREPFLSITSGVIFAILGLIFANAAATTETINLANVEVTSSVSWALTGVLFIMAYFSLVHLKYK
jgi:hypothetical protein